MTNGAPQTPSYTRTDFDASDALARVTVVLVTYNSAHCLARQGMLLARCPHVIVVDNNSADAWREATARAMPQARTIGLERNVGFGAGNNVALAQIRTPFALLLNPDCEIASEAIETLVHVADTWPDAAVVAPQLLKGHGTPTLDINYRWPTDTWAPKGPGAEGPACVGFLCGAAMLWRISAFEGVGFFDPRFFLYYEDDDLCLRLFKARRSMLIAPEAEARHHARRSVRGGVGWRHEFERGYHHAQSKLTFMAKHRSLVAARHTRLKLLWITTLTLPLRLLLLHPRLLMRMAGRWQGVLTWKPPTA